MLRQLADAVGLRQQTFAASEIKPWASSLSPYPEQSNSIRRTRGDMVRATM